MRYKFWSCQHIDIIESHGTECNYLGEKPSKRLLSESMDAKRGAEANDSLTEHSDVRGEAGLALGMQGKVGMVWICEFQVPAPHSIRDFQEVLTNVCVTFEENYS